MNTGKLCVSINAETAKEFIEKIKQASEFADVIELRFDYLEEPELENGLEETCNMKTEKEFLLTFRPKEQGGMRELTREDREIFWSSGYDFCAHWADVEEDLIETASHWLFEKLICSHHEFSANHGEIDEIYENLKQTKADVLKIAVQTEDITDSLPIWKLLKKAKKDGKEIIPIAMGESGKWTRILGLAHGAFMTYASLDSGQETAPGQVSARDLEQVYRAKNLDETTDIYGILGSNTGVSLSPYIHNAAFKYHDLNACFVPFQVRDLDEFMRRMVKAETREIDLNFKGFSVTIPHKQTIIEHLDFVDEIAAKIGAVNTVKIVDGKLYGYNTDANGFIEPLLNSYGDLAGAKVAVLGAGGSARACVYALKNAGANVTIFARNAEKAKGFADEFEVELKELSTTDFKDFDILVNTTPLGMKGKNVGETPVLAEQLKGLKMVYDLVYIPSQTALMTETEAAEIPKIGGMAMLIAQAAEQQKIWTNLAAPIKEMSDAAFEKLG